MRQVIKTKYLSPTNHRGSRVKATCVAGSKTVDWLHELNAEQNHKRAIEFLHAFLGWDKSMTLVFGWDAHSMIAVLIPKESKNAPK